jgi:Ni/Fe-hydrogenase subunit HybB-like protein
MKLRILKTILWFLSGAGLTVILLRIIHGPGSVTALTDILPWGLWKGGGVVALVPIGGAGFTLAALVYIFHWDRYKPLARGAVLLGLMCYSSVGIGLTFDIGIWWRIVYPVVFWQFHSTLFEIAWCIMLYLGVLAVEFSHAVVERFNMPKLLALIKKVSIVFVILGISLSTLHQSSLGTLFLATPFRLHPLWHTDLLPFMFFITSIGLGCLTISWVALLIHWLYDAEQPMHPISGLGRISAIVLSFYLVLKFAEIFIAGEGSLLAAPGLDSLNFWLEILLSALIPVALLLFKKFRTSPTAMFWISTSAIVGVSLNRVNVAGLATQTATQSVYFPIWPEWAITVGILSVAGLVFLFCVENFSVFPAINRKRVVKAYSGQRVDHADWKTFFFRNPLASVRFYSMAFVIAAGLTFGCLPEGSVYGVKPLQTPTQRPRTVEVLKVANPDEQGSKFLASAGDPTDQQADPTNVMSIDGNRDGEHVLFDHAGHAARLGGKSVSCQLCHHMNKPQDKATACHECHSDMYLAVDIFKHKLHVDKLGGNGACEKCHSDPEQLKVRENTTACEKCHQDMRSSKSLVSSAGPVKNNKACGYKDAMHNLCITCHKKQQKPGKKTGTGLAGCTRCHQEPLQLSEQSWKPGR